MKLRDQVEELVENYGLYYLVHQIAGVIANETATMALEGRTKCPKYATRCRQFEALSKALKKL
jgi:hypothetical protein